MTLIYLGCAWIAGIFAGAGFSPPQAVILTGFAPLPLLFFLRHHQKIIILVSLCLFAFFGGILRLHLSQPNIDERHLAFYNDQGNVALKGMVSTEPDIRDTTIQLRLSASAVRLDGGWHEVCGSVLLFVPRYSTYRYGDMLLVTGELETPIRFEDFDYQGYLSRQGIYSTMLYPRIDILDRDQGLRPLAWVYSVKSHLSRTLAQVLPEPQASLAQDITLGIRGNIPPSVRDRFSQTGTAHLLAISGLHLSILAGILASTSIWLFGKRHHIYIWLTLSLIWLYALISGLHPPVVRATIMVSLFLIAELLGRQRSAITALVLAAAVMVGINPQILWTASFQMSVMAMVGLIFVAPLFQALGRKAVSVKLSEEGKAANTVNMISDAFSISLGAIIGVGPLVAHYFGIVSLVGPPATFLALPALPAIIIIGALAGALGFIALPVAQVIGWLAWLPLSYLLAVVNTFAAIPSASVEIPSLHPGIVGSYYLALASGLWFYYRHHRLSVVTAQYTTPIKLSDE